MLGAVLCAALPPHGSRPGRAAGPKKGGSQALNQLVDMLGIGRAAVRHKAELRRFADMHALCHLAAHMAGRAACPAR